MTENAALLEQFFHISRMMHQEHHRGGAKGGESCRGQGRALILLMSHPDISQKELASLLDIRSQSLSELIAKLEESGCIVKAVSEEDRRAVRLRLTSKGERAAARAKKNREESSALFDCLSGEEKTELDRLLIKLTAAFEKAAKPKNDGE